MRISKLNLLALAMLCFLAITFSGCGERSEAETEKEQMEEGTLGQE